jgi:hypothetical protein
MGWPLRLIVEQRFKARKTRREKPRTILAYIHFCLSRNSTHLRVFSRVRIGTARRLSSGIRLETTGVMIGALGA